MHGGFVADGEFVLAGGGGAVAFEAVDAAFDGMMLLADFAVGGGRPAAGAALVLAVADLIGFFRDGAGDAAAAQVTAVSPKLRRRVASI